jgi:hypothetical protein
MLNETDLNTIFIVTKNYENMTGWNYCTVYKIRCLFSFKLKLNTSFVLGNTTIPKSWKMELLKPEFKKRSQ